MISPDGSLLLQRRDDLPHVSSPGMLSIFGGMVEGDEDFADAMFREIEEETGLRLQSDDVCELTRFTIARPGLQTSEGGFFLVRNVDPEELAVTEGCLEIVNPEQIGSLIKQIVPTSMLAISIYLQRVG